MSGRRGAMVGLAGILMAAVALLPSRAAGAEGAAAEKPSMLDAGRQQAASEAYRGGVAGAAPSTGVYTMYGSGPSATIGPTYPIPGPADSRVAEKIREALAVTHALDFVDTPIEDVLMFLKDLTKVEMILDKGSGIKGQEAITLNLAGIPFAALLQAIEDRYPSWQFVVRDYGILLTTREKARELGFYPAIAFARRNEGGDGLRTPAPPAKLSNREKVYTVAYQVADLVVPLPSPPLPLDGTRPAAGQAGSNADFAPLIGLITNTIQPATWDAVGGRGSIAPHKGSLSIVVSQTKDVHEQIVDLTEGLRRQQDISVALEVRMLRVQDQAMPAETQGKGLERGAGIGPPQTEQLLEALRQHQGVDCAALSQTTVLNGQTAFLSPLEDGDARTVPLVTQVVISNDRRFIRLWLGTADSGKSLASAWIGDGRSLVVAIPLDQSERYGDRRHSEAKPVKVQRLLLITPRIVIMDEEEQRQTQCRELDPGARVSQIPEKPQGGRYPNSTATAAAKQAPSPHSNPPDGAAATPNVTTPPLTPQVMLQLRILELDYAKVRAAGFDLKRLGIDPQARQAGSGCSVLKGETAAELAEALLKDKLARPLAEPTPVTLSGRPAQFQCGGE
ncbi:MAG: hypothetical protein ABR915_21865, partial [Thermoguttaceae bacterium]